MNTAEALEYAKEFVKTHRFWPGLIGSWRDGMIHCFECKAVTSPKTDMVHELGCRYQVFERVIEQVFADKEVYVVTTGQYSDYQIRRIFSDRAEADAYRSFLVWGVSDQEARVEEWILDEDLADQHCIRVVMQPDGMAAQVGPADWMHPGFDSFNPFDRHSGGTRLRELRPSDRDLTWGVVVLHGEDLEAAKVRAIKVVNEKRAQILAANLWGDDAAVRALFGQVEVL